MAVDAHNDSAACIQFGEGYVLRMEICHELLAATSHREKLLNHYYFQRNLVKDKSKFFQIKALKMGFFKDWAANAAQAKRLQQDLTVIFAERGINFMHLAPDVHKCLLGISRESGAQAAVSQFDELVQTITSSTPGISQQQVAQQLVAAAKVINAMAR